MYIGHGKPTPPSMIKASPTAVSRCARASEMAQAPSVHINAATATALAAKRADLCLLARAHLYDPYWVRHAAAAQGYKLPWPKPYGVLDYYTFRGE